MFLKKIFLYEMELTYDKDEVGTVSYKTSGVVYVSLAQFTWLYLYLLNT